MERLGNINCMYIHENKYVSFVSQEVLTPWISILTNIISAKPFRVITVLMGNYLMQYLHFLLHLESMSIYSDKFMRKKPSNIVSIPQIWIPFHHSLIIKPVVTGICFQFDDQSSKWHNTVAPFIRTSRLFLSTRTSLIMFILNVWPCL